MKKLVKYFLLVWIWLMPVGTNAHSGHGLMGEEHYHSPIGVEILIGLVVVVLLVLGWRYFFNKR